MATASARKEEEDENMDESLISINVPKVEEDLDNNRNIDLMLSELVVADRDRVNKGTKLVHIPPADPRVLNEL